MGLVFLAVSQPRSDGLELEIIHAEVPKQFHCDPIVEVATVITRIGWEPFGRIVGPLGAI